MQRAPNFRPVAHVEAGGTDKQCRERAEEQQLAFTSQKTVMALIILQEVVTGGLVAGHPT